MKIKIFGLFFLSIIITQACFITKNTAKKTEKKLHGTWTYSKIDFISTDSENKSEIIKYLNETYKGSFLELSKVDMSYKKKFGNDLTTGTWYASETGNEIHFSDGNIYIIDALNQTDLTVVIRGETRNSDVFLFLKKSK